MLKTKSLLIKGGVRRVDEVSSECVSELITCQCLRPIEMGKPSPGQSKDADSVCRK